MDNGCTLGSSRWLHGENANTSTARKMCLRSSEKQMMATGMLMTVASISFSYATPINRSAGDHIRDVDSFEHLDSAFVKFGQFWKSEETPLVVQFPIRNMIKYVTTLGISLLQILKVVLSYAECLNILNVDRL